jgi:outer membrane protein OmpA-like peptidoglycan-associated protein
MRWLIGSFLLLEAGCHRNHAVLSRLPFGPVPIMDSQPAPVSVEPRPAVVAVVTSPTPTLVNDPVLLLKLADAYFDLDQHALREDGRAALRSEAGKEFLVELGILAAALKTITYGKERPQCTSQDESCWQKNRRVHLSEAH